MPRSPLKPTLAVQNRIGAFIRAGGFPHIAAQAEGIPPEVFDDWLRRGQRRRGPAIYQHFADAVSQAIAQARLKAETAVFADNPLNWLKFGPGKQTPACPGWTNPVKAPAASKQESGNPLLQPEIAALIRRVQDELESFPELRVRVAAAVAGPAK